MLVASQSPRVVALEAGSEHGPGRTDEDPLCERGEVDHCSTCSLRMHAHTPRPRDCGVWTSPGCKAGARDDYRGRTGVASSAGSRQSARRSRRCVTGRCSWFPPWRSAASREGPAGIEPARTESQSARLPLHHGPHVALADAQTAQVGFPGFEPRTTRPKRAVIAKFHQKPGGRWSVRYSVCWFKGPTFPPCDRGVSVGWPA